MLKQHRLRNVESDADNKKRLDTRQQQEVGRWGVKARVPMTNGVSPTEGLHRRSSFWRI